VEVDQALEIFLKFHPLQFYGKLDQEQEVELWKEQMEDIFAALNYTDQWKI
jgi:hypothetical protein